MNIRIIILGLHVGYISGGNVLKGNTDGFISKLKTLNISVGLVLVVKIC